MLLVVMISVGAGGLYMAMLPGGFKLHGHIPDSVFPQRFPDGVPQIVNRIGNDGHAAGNKIPVAENKIHIAKK